MSTQNPEVMLTLDDAVAEVLGNLTGLDLEYQPELDRYRAITRQLNRALRYNALEQEWSYYASVEEIGSAAYDEDVIYLPESVRPRMISDDAVRLVDDDQIVRCWAYFLPRDAIHKYRSRRGLWVAVNGTTLQFSRPFTMGEDGLAVQVPIMREPTMFRLPDEPEDPDEPLVTVPDEIRQQPVDFAYPDVIVARAAFFYAQTDPIMQPRVQTLEAQYKDLMYQIMERDKRNTDAPMLNEFVVPVQASIDGAVSTSHLRPYADRGWY